MNIKIKLDNPKYCNGCPCVKSLYDRCKYFDIKLKEKFSYFGYPPQRNWIGRIRPKKCIKENGE